MTEKLSLLGRDRVLVDKLTKEIQKSVKHPTRGPYETRRGSTFDVQGTLDDEPTGRIYKVTIELTEVVQV